MPAATTKQALLDVTAKEFAKLEKLIDPIPAKIAMVKDQDDVSIKDIIGHRCYWIDLFMGWYADGVAGREVHMPAEGYSWGQLNDLNASIRASQKRLSWRGAKEMLAGKHAELVAFIEDTPDSVLYGGPMPGHDKWTTGRFAEASGASHYRSAAKAIRAALRAQAA